MEKRKEGDRRACFGKNLFRRLIWEVRDYRERLRERERERKRGKEMKFEFGSGGTSKTLQEKDVGLSLGRTGS